MRRKGVNKQIGTMATNITEKLLKIFGLLSKASARKKVYSQRARQAGRSEVGHLLRAMSASDYAKETKDA